MPEKKWEIEAYEKPNGRCPTEDFLDNLTVEERVFVDRAFARLKIYGHELRRPHVDYLRDGIWELRVRVIKIRYRLLFFYDERKIIITHGIKKQSSKVPDEEIDRALEYRNDYFQNK